MAGIKNEQAWNTLAVVMVSLMLVFVSTSPAFALGEGSRNLLLIGLMAGSPLLLLFFPAVNWRVELAVLILILLQLLLPALRHPDTMRISTFLFSCLFYVFFLVYTRVLGYDAFTLDHFAGVLKGLLYAYFIVLLIQQICVLGHFPIFNLGIGYDGIHDKWKLNSLMSESSHAARVTSLLMYVYVSVRKLQIPDYSLRNSFILDGGVWVAFLWPALTMMSSTAFLFMILVFLSFVDFQRDKLSLLVVIVAIIPVLFVVRQLPQFRRMERFARAVMTLDVQAIDQADNSAAQRVVPSLNALEVIGFSSADDWFGHGVDADAELVTPARGAIVITGGAFSVWINYGLLFQLIFWLFTFFIIHNRMNIGTWIIWLLYVFMYGVINSQIVWFAMIMMYTLKYLQHNEDPAL